MHSLSRNSLYDLVWSKPMITVAAEFEITGTALKKTCDRHSIPTPERGYWAKLAHGKKVKQVSLPELGDPRLETIRIGQGYKASFPEPVRKAVAEARERASKVPTDAPTVALPEMPSLPVSEPAFLAATRRAMSKARADIAGFAEGGGKGVVAFRIGPASTDHAIEALARLFAAAEARGFTHKATDIGLALLVEGEPIAFSVTEQPRKTPHTPTPKELKQKDDNARWGYGSDTPWPKYDHAPSGRLAIVIAGNEYSGLRRTYSERETRKLENMVPDILVGMAEHAAYAKARRREDEERQETWRQQELRRKAETAYVEHEAQREKFVDAVARQLERRDKLLRVLAHVENSAGLGSDRPAGLADWLRRRLRQIDALVSPDFLDLTARSAKVDFRRTPGENSDETGGYFYRPPEIELKLWEIDATEGIGRARSQREWEELITRDGATPDESA